MFFLSAISKFIIKSTLLSILKQWFLNILSELTGHDATGLSKLNDPEKIKEFKTLYPHLNHIKSVNFNLESGISKLKKIHIILMSVTSMHLLSNYFTFFILNELLNLNKHPLPNTHTEAPRQPLAQEWPKKYITQLLKQRPKHRFKKIRHRLCNQVQALQLSIHVKHRPKNSQYTNAKLGQFGHSLANLLQRVTHIETALDQQYIPQLNALSHQHSTHPEPNLAPPHFMKIMTQVYQKLSIQSKLAKRFSKDKALQKRLWPKQTPLRYHPTHQSIRQNTIAHISTQYQNTLLTQSSDQLTQEFSALYQDYQTWFQTHNDPKNPEIASFLDTLKETGTHIQTLCEFLLVIEQKLQLLRLQQSNRHSQSKNQLTVT